MAESASELLEDAARRAAGDEVSISIRDLIKLWGAKRRGAWAVGVVNQSLLDYGLRSEPHFEDGWIDNVVRLVPDRTLEPKSKEGASVEGDPGAEGDAEPVQSHPLRLKISSLESANRKVASIDRNASLSTAMSLMIGFNYSQIAVIEKERKLIGVVSWESIGRVQMHMEAPSLSDCVDREVKLVGLGDDLLPLVATVIEDGYVFVREADERICGIVTTADLSAQFVVLAGPFLLLGDLERDFRRVVNSKFSRERIRESVDPRDSKRAAVSAEDLTFGEMIRLFESRESWAGLGWSIDRVVFLDLLNDVRELRNDIMHFSPDPIEPERVDRARNLLRWLQMIDS